MKNIKLNNGVIMPQIGLGTFLIPKDKLSKTICCAYELGYRQYDTAWRYHNEVEIGEILRSNGIKREDVFITTKVNADALYRFGYRYGKHRICNIRNFKSIRQVIEESFKNLNTEYIDLFLVHWPWPMYKDMYRELTKIYHEGRIRAIGVSSFTIGHLESLKEISDVKPMVNQIEMSPLNNQKELVDYCQRNGIVIEAMSTFSHYRSVEPRLEILENPIIKPIAEKHHKSIAQTVLRWLIQKDVIVIPKTWDENHLKENIDILDFELTDQEMAIIDSLDQGKCLNYNPYAPHIVKGIPKKYRHLTPIK